MPTLKEILENSDPSEKVASAAPVQSESSEELRKIAMDLNIYEELFPEDSEKTASEEKTAEEEKVAAYQEALGARAYDFFAARFDARMNKIAGEVMSQVSLDAAPAIMQPSASAPQRIPNNQDPVGDKAPMTPAPVGATPYSVAAGAEHGAEGQVGKEEQHKMAAAIRKHFIIAAMQ